jgi:hypothetical protein
MQDKLTNFFLNQEEPLQGTLLALHDYILALHPEVSVAWKWSSPFFTYQGKNFCYLWMDKKTRHPYIGFIDGHKIDHPLLISDGRKQIKVLSINPEEDFPHEAMKQIFKVALKWSQNEDNK